MGHRCYTLRQAFRPRGVCDNLFLLVGTIFLFISTDPSAPNLTPRWRAEFTFSTIGRSMGRFFLIFGSHKSEFVLHCFINNVLVDLFDINSILSSFFMKLRDHRNLVFCKKAKEMTAFCLSWLSLFFHFSGIDFCLVFSITFNSFRLPKASSIYHFSI